MSEISEARARARQREADREKARLQRKEEAAARRKQRSRDGSTERGIDPDDQMAAAGWDRAGDRERQAARAKVAGSGVFAPEANPPSREDQVLAHAAQLQAENRDTLRNTIKVARETAQVGAATIHKLDEQTEQFQRMDNTMTETQDTLSRSERIIKGMKSWSGALGNMFSSKPKKHSGSGPSAALSSDHATSSLEEKDRLRAQRKVEEAAAARKVDMGDLDEPSSPQSYETITMPGKAGSAAAAAGAAAAPVRPVVAPNARQTAAMSVMASNQREEDAALEELSDVLGALKEQSQVMNQQLNTHNQMIDQIESKVDNTTGRLMKGTRTMQKIS